MSKLPPSKVSQTHSKDPRGWEEVNGLRKDLTRSEIRCTIISFYDMINAQKKMISCTCEYDPLEYFGQEPNNNLVYSVLMKQAPGCSASVTTTASIYNESFVLGMCLTVIYKWLKVPTHGKKCERNDYYTQTNIVRDTFNVRAVAQLLAHVLMGTPDLIRFPFWLCMVIQALVIQFFC